MKAPQEIIALVERFDQNLQAYQSGKYNETQLRREFIDPFFKALGWDVENTSGYAEAYKDVIHEDAIKIGSANKAPDSSFRIGGTRKFFVEAKKPSVNIAEDIGPAYQLRRYAWSAKLSLSILSDFEEFAVYDCRVKPDKADKASTARIIYLKYKEYLTRWEEIASIFSKEALMKGSFDKYAETTKTKRGTAGVDAAFLSEIDSWRQTLAQNIALRNLSLTQRELNFAVTKTIDRIIFLRICEDRGIEPYGRLMALQNGADVYPRLTKYFYDADDKYNSGLFHFKREKDRFEPPDDLTLTLSVDDKILKDIFKSLYYPESPYEFSVLPADILGQVYEQFLGKVIHLTPGHRARVEEKPEVRKAGGVYYTPTYIVDYIVKNTVGKLLEGKTPKAAKKLRILDPACGSGSFLIGAYQYLLDWHRDKYIEDGAEKHAKGKDPKLYQRIRNEWRLTTAERKRILLNNIYGVDIDPQAVEVTKLSLLLKVLEGESDETIKSAFRLFNERALPDLGNNIKCGNSLIGPDFYEGKQTSFLDTEEMQRVNAFDWEREFPEIFKAGGFDAVIGNPPYIRIQALNEWAPTEVEHFKRAYKSAQKGNYDIYVVFVEKGLQLLNNNGRLGFILPNKFFNSQYGEPLRKLIADGKHLADVIHFGDKQIFVSATTYTCLLFLEKQERKDFRFEKIEDLQAWKDDVKIQKSARTNEKISASRITASEWNFATGANGLLFQRLNSSHPKLGQVADIFVGLQTSADRVFIMNLVGENNSTLILKSAVLNQEWELEKDLLHPLVSGTDVKRFCPLPERQYILFPYRLENGIANIISINEIEKKYPKTAKYLLANKKTLENREKGKFKDQEWHRFGRNQNLGIQELVKLCVPRLVEYLYATIDHYGSHYLDNVDVGGITLKKNYENLKLFYLLGLLNSSVLRWFFPFVSAPFRGGWLSANRQFLSQLPIRIINFENQTDKAKHHYMLQLVEQMLLLHKQLAEAKTDHDQTLIRRQIDATDNQIDKLVYELYDLTPEEITIVERSI